MNLYLTRFFFFFKSLRAWVLEQQLCLLPVHSLAAYSCDVSVSSQGPVWLSLLPTPCVLVFEWSFTLAGFWTTHWPAACCVLLSAPEPLSIQTLSLLWLNRWAVDLLGCTQMEEAANRSEVGPQVWTLLFLMLLIEWFYSSYYLSSFYSYSHLFLFIMLQVCFD